MCEQKTNYKLIISYLGTNYYGWQVQPELLTIQQTLQDLLSQIFNHQIVLRYSSRTDSGVHALAQCASFKSIKKWDVQKLKKAINTLLPLDIVVNDVHIVNDEFDARHSLKKTYFYLINNNDVRSVFDVNKVWWVKYKLDIFKMQKALKYIKGEHDFVAFMGSGSSIKTTVRTVYDIDLLQNMGNIKLTITSNGFLKQMVRNIVGTLVEVGRGRFKPEYLEEIIKSENRSKAGITAPAYGLYLERIYYEE